MNYEELLVQDPLKEEYLRMYKGCEHACTYEDFLRIKRFVESLYE